MVDNEGLNNYSVFAESKCVKCHWFKWRRIPSCKASFPKDREAAMCSGIEGIFCGQANDISILVLTIKKG